MLRFAVERAATPPLLMPCRLPLFTVGFAIYYDVFLMPRYARYA